MKKDISYNTVIDSDKMLDRYIQQVIEMNIVESKTMTGRLKLIRNVVDNLLSKCYNKFYNVLSLITSITVILQERIFSLMMKKIDWRLVALVITFIIFMIIVASCAARMNLV